MKAKGNWVKFAKRCTGLLLGMISLLKPPDLPFLHGPERLCGSPERRPE